jgi:ech hydrogenase subunit F
MGLGKMTKVALKSVFKKPATRIEARPAFTATRGHIEIKIDTCTYCTLCMRKCPPGAITVDRVARVWQIDQLKCIVCGECVLVCNPKSLSMSTAFGTSQATKAIEHYHTEAPPKPAAPEIKPGA